MFIIKDWAGNICFADKYFETFEDAWDFLYETFPDENVNFDDYVVVENS